MTRDELIPQAADLADILRPARDRVDVAAVEERLNRPHRYHAARLAAMYGDGQPD